MVKLSVYLIFNIALFCSSTVFSQSNDSIIEIGNGLVEYMPKYENGYLGLLQFIETNIQYPSKALADSIEGVVYVSFIVDINGKTSNHKILRGIREDIDNEALRVAKMLFFEKPAIQRGKSIEFEYIVPIRFFIINKM